MAEPAPDAESNMRVVTVVGARPQFIKAAPVSLAFEAAGLDEILVHTGQHYDANMSDVFFDELGIAAPAHHLGVGSGSHGTQTAAMLTGIEQVLIDEQPDAVVLYGDTNSTLAGAVAASKLHIPVAHIEAGLRSFNMAMPEEINRRLTDHVSELLLCPSDTAAANLAAEGIADGVSVVGDVMLDAVRTFTPDSCERVTRLERRGIRAPFALATVHRAENTNDPARFASILDALAAVADERPVIFPVHPRTRGLLPDDLAADIHVIEPLGYLDMLSAIAEADVGLTDSGGMQKELYWLETPCVTMRDETEWVETVDAGWNQIVSADRDAIVAAAQASPPAERPNLYGDGTAAESIARTIATLGVRR